MCEEVLQKELNELIDMFKRCGVTPRMDSATLFDALGRDQFYGAMNRARVVVQKILYYSSGCAEWLARNREDVRQLVLLSTRLESLNLRKNIGCTEPDLTDMPMHLARLYDVLEMGGGGGSASSISLDVAGQLVDANERLDAVRAGEWTRACFAAVDLTKDADGQFWLGPETGAVEDKVSVQHDLQEERALVQFCDLVIALLLGPDVEQEQFHVMYWLAENYVRILKVLGVCGALCKVRPQGFSCSLQTPGVLDAVVQKLARLNKTVFRSIIAESEAIAKKYPVFWDLFCISPMPSPEGSPKGSPMHSPAHSPTVAMDED